MIKDYYTLAKPGIVYGNAITAIAGFILASRGHVDVLALCAMLIGISLVIASGCVFNNYIDRDIDALMERTKRRVLVRGAIPLARALVYGAVLGILGLAILFFYTNIVTLIISVIGLFFYVVVYSLWLKRTSVHSALIGSISGAVPLVVGYVAVTGYVDVGAVLLFLILSLWQMPHSFAIAIYRLDDYVRAGIPVFPRERGIHKTKIQVLVYGVLFVLSTLLLTACGYAGWSYLFVMGILGIFFIALCARGLYIRAPHDIDWARKVFRFSIIILVIFCVVVSVDAIPR